ncbi:MAG: hypothetical protein IVW36_05405 [Dehalococcoidia bacterium]|nr:hypothetical protein [Dehalococcoidia bacterium]
MRPQSERPALLQLDLLVGRGVYDRDGRKIAAVSEVPLRRRGDQYVVDGLHVGVLAWFERVGFVPALRALGALFRFAAWRPEVRRVRWAQIASIEPHKVCLHALKDELEVVEPGD